MTSDRISLELIEIPTLPSGLVRRFLAAVKRWRRRAHLRGALANFDSRMLRDIGVTEAEVGRETRLPPWGW